MNLPTVFKRTNASPVDTLPAGGPDVSDFIGAYSFQNPSGSPGVNALVAYNGPDASVAATLWMWEGSTRQWVQAGGALTLTKATLTKVPVVSPYGTVQSRAAGGLDLALIVAQPVAAGEHVFALGVSAS